MIKHLPIYALSMFVFCTSCKGQSKTELQKEDIKSKTKEVIAADSIKIANKIHDWTNRWRIEKYQLANKWYSVTTSQGIIIQNSFPKGGRYTDPTGKDFGYAIFWTRIVNETSTPFELRINFPADSFVIVPSPHCYLKLFLPPDTMTLDKESLYDYGTTGLKSFLDTGLHKPTMLLRTINPNEACIFMSVRDFVGQLAPHEQDLS